MGEFVKTYRAKGLIWMNDKAEGLASPVLKFLTESEIAAVREATIAKMLLFGSRDHAKASRIGQA